MAMIMKVLLVKKEEWSSEAHNLECHEVLDLGLDLDLEKENLDVKIEKLERKILELRMEGILYFIVQYTSRCKS